jgi:hypothetical protein
VVARRWSDLSQRDRRLIVGAGALDAILRLAVLADLRGRPDEQVRGSKRAWRISVAVVNSAGVLPLAYFLFGRRKPAGRS